MVKSQNRIIFSLFALVSVPLLTSCFTLLTTQSSYTTLKFHKERLSNKYSLFMENQNQANDVGFGEMTSALALLDSQWKKDKKQSWQKIEVQKDLDSVSSTSLEEKKEFIYYLPPQRDASEPPSSIILFLGGAGLGQYPHITYSSLLTNLSKKSNTAVFAAPYNVQLDHFELAKSSGDLLRRAILQYEDKTLPLKDKNGQPHQYSADIDLSEIPKYALCHSLGAKLQLIFMAATNFHLELKGIGIMAFNNFGLTDSIKMTQSFLNMGGKFKENNAGSPMLDTIFQFAEQAINTIGIEFTPSPSQMNTLLQMKFTTEMQQKCRLFTFDNDDLDSTPSLLECDKKNNNNNDLEVSNLVGTHLSPVYLEYKLEDLDIEEDMKNVMGQFANNIQQISWGDERHLNVLIDEINGWMIGNPPSNFDTGNRNNDRLLSGIIDAEIE